MHSTITKKRVLLSSLVPINLWYEPIEGGGGSLVNPIIDEQQSLKERLQDDVHALLDEIQDNTIAGNSNLIKSLIAETFDTVCVLERTISETKTRLRYSKMPNSDYDYSNNNLKPIVDATFTKHIEVLEIQLSVANVIYKHLLMLLTGSSGANAPMKFNGSKLKLQLFFMLFINMGLFDVDIQKEYELFLENNFVYWKKGEYHKVEKMNITIAKIRDYRIKDESKKHNDGLQYEQNKKEFLTAAIDAADEFKVSCIQALGEQLIPAPKSKDRIFTKKKR